MQVRVLIECDEPDIRVPLLALITRALRDLSYTTKCIPASIHQELAKALLSDREGLDSVHEALKKHDLTIVVAEQVELPPQMRNAVNNGGVVSDDLSSIITTKLETSNAGRELVKQLGIDKNYIQEILAKASAEIKTYANYEDMTAVEKAHAQAEAAETLLREALNEKMPTSQFMVQAIIANDGTDGGPIEIQLGVVMLRPPTDDDLPGSEQEPSW